MSIKNIIQQENDLQEMSPQSLANYLNNPTGQYNPYLVAGELQRKEQFAQRQMVEAPKETVVDELVQKTMPMGGMSQPMPPSMPMPRPQEAMVSDTITETGIANLPAPNIGQNYADGGIVGYAEGTLVGEDDILQSGEFRYEEMGPENENYETYLEEIRKIPEPSFSGISQMKRNELIQKVKDKYKSPYKEKIDVIEAENTGGFYFDPKTSSGFNPLRGLDFRQYTDQQREDLKYLKAEQKKYYKGKSKIQEKDKAQKAAKAAEEAEARGLAALKASENKANSRAERDAYLALAMGGAKTMAGQSPFALTNIGEGLGAGIGALSQSDANERARVDAQRTAYEKYMYDMNANQRLSGKEYADLITDIQASDEYRFLLEQKAEGKNIDKDDPKYQVLIQETIRELLPLYGNSGASNSTTVNGKPFSRV